MRRLLQILLLVAVLHCGSHAPEAGVALEPLAYQLDADMAGAAGDDGSHGNAKAAVHAGHHHCPIATCAAADMADAGITSAREARFAPPTPVLASLSHAPPLEPPAA